MYRSLLAKAGFSAERLANFCAVADAGSIAAAAKGDPNAASLMSRQIRELEGFFGAELVRRKGRGLELTAAGTELASVGRQSFKGLADFAARWQGGRWCARVVASNSVAQWLLLPRLGAIAAAAPGARFEVHHEQTREMVRALREGVYDIALVRRDALGEGLKCRPLGELGHSLFVPRALSARKPASAARALVGLPVALPVAGQMREAIERLAAGAGGAPNVAVACSSYLQAAALVASGACAAVLPDTAARELAANKPHRLPVPVRFALCVAWSARNAETRPALMELIDVMHGVLARRG